MIYLLNSAPEIRFLRGAVRQGAPAGRGPARRAGRRDGQARRTARARL